MDSLPLAGRDGVGVVPRGTGVPNRTTPTPNPSPHKVGFIRLCHQPWPKSDKSDFGWGGENFAGSSRHIFTPYFAATGASMRTRSFMIAVKGASRGAS
jgi:hypothetical protein